MISGQQRYQNIRTKARIIDQRNIRAYLAGNLPWCPGTVIDDLITKEFDRMRAELENFIKNED